MTEQYVVVTKYAGHPVLGDWESRTRPMTLERANKYAMEKATRMPPNVEKKGFLQSIGVQALDALEGLSFNDNEMTVEFWGGNGLNEPTVDIEIRSGEIKYDRDYNTETEITGSYWLSMDEAETLHAFLGEALKRAGRGK